MSSTTPAPALASALWSALGTTVLLCVTEPEALEQATELLERELAEIDRVASRFRPDSELERLNDRAGSWSVVGPELYAALAVALAAARFSGGLVDPTLGGTLIAAGYDRDWAELERTGFTSTSPRERTRRRRSSWRGVAFVEQPDGGAWVCLPPGIRLDLGATAKAYAADLAADRIASVTGVGVLVSLGGDIATAGAPPQGGWLIHVTDDHRAGLSAPGQTVRIQGGALATSSTTVRRWRGEAGEMHHILDPRTGLPAAGPWRTVSVTAADCVDANTATTAAIVLGAQAPAWLAELGFAARLVAHDGRVTTLGGWPQDES
jgi:thiamine biosynthesis lipoprotein